MVSFYIEKQGFKLAQKAKLKTWIKTIVHQHKGKITEINYIFVSDEALYQINVERLQHDYYTDIITFYYHAEGEPIMSDIYISIDRVTENALSLSLKFEDELHRVMIHGILHLLGFDDHDGNEIEMRKQEDYALTQRDFN